MRDPTRPTPAWQSTLTPLMPAMACCVLWLCVMVGVEGVGRQAGVYTGSGADAAQQAACTCQPRAKRRHSSTHCSTHPTDTRISRPTCRRQVGVHVVEQQVGSLRHRHPRQDARVPGRAAVAIRGGSVAGGIR